MKKERSTILLSNTLKTNYLRARQEKDLRLKETFPPLAKGKRGSVSLVAMLFIFIISLLLYLSYQNIIYTEQEIRSRAIHYLCVKEQIINHKNLIDKIEQANRLIYLGLAMQAKIATAAAGQQLIRFAQHTQNAINKIGSLKVLSSRYCSKALRPYLLSVLPYSFKIKRNFAGLALLRRKKWTFQYPSIGNNKFLTSITMSANGLGSTKLNSTLREINPKGLLTLSF